jgi:hypothetical protein
MNPEYGVLQRTSTEYFILTDPFAAHGLLHLFRNRLDLPLCRCTAVPLGVPDQDN